jgi:predicted alpha/beta superfamily hydrolase
MQSGQLLDPQPVVSRHLNDSRVVRVFLPPSYPHARRRRYPVLYVQDGQNVFSPAGSGACYGWGGWELDQVANRLCAGGHMREIVIVAIESSEERHLEYRGRAYPCSRQALARRGRQGQWAGDSSRFEQYSRFLRCELKPQIDARYRTRPEAAHTGLMGASLGGLCSLVLAWEHPRTFGLVACLSGSFQVEKRHFAENMLGRWRGPRKPIRIYLDSGFLDYRDDDGRRRTAAVAAHLRRCGWEDGINLRHHVDTRLLTDLDLGSTALPLHKWREARQSQHNELYWRLRVRNALEFLFPPLCAS